MSDLRVTETLTINGIDITKQPPILIPGGINWRWNWIDALIKQYGWKVGAELGVKEGRCSTFLLMNNPDLFLHAVDLWNVQEGNDQKEGGETYENWDNEGFYKAFSKAVDNNFVDRCKIWRGYTDWAVDFIEDDSLDFVFIDADHSFEGVSGDIQNWKSKVKADGAILGHDYSWPSVQKAITQEFSDPSKVWTGWNNTWGIWKKDI